jgi:hypothetical protein
MSETEVLACAGLVAMMGVIGSLLRLEWDTGRGRALLLLTVAAIVGAAVGFR